MADEYDPDIVESMLEECLTQMRMKGRDFPREITKLVRELADLAQVRPKAAPTAAPATAPAGGAAPAATATEGEKKVISARACVVCGRDDRPGEQRKSGFKCHECIGLPSQSKFTVEVEEHDHMSRTTNEFGEKVVNEFAFVRALGRGSYGKVKLAVHNKSNQQYAVKILNKSNLMRVHGAIDKVHQEIRIMKAMSHPNIIKIYTIIDDPDEYKMYLVMEFLEGGQIYDIDSTGTGKGTVEKERLKKYIVGIAQGLTYLHGKGIVHRDIKPENILLDKHDNVKLADFGVSSTCDSENDTMTATEGSPAFLPPEEFLGVPVQGRAQDVWAFGVTVYTMAFGHLPFRAKSRKELEDMVVNHEPEFPADADPFVVDLIKKMMMKDQNKRVPISGILDHPFVADVRCVKGFPVETITANLKVVDTAAEASAIKDEKIQAVIVRQKGHESKGSTELLSFLAEEGPEFQMVRGGVYSVTLYSIKSDPRRKLQRKYIEQWEKERKDKEALSKSTK